MTPSPDTNGSTGPSTSMQIAALDGGMRLESGTHLDSVEIGYRTWGRPAKEAILVCHALTGSADAADWWSGLFGAGRALDPDSDFIVCANVLGGCYGSTGPASVARHLGRRWGADFPTVTIRDMVHAQARLLDSLGVERLKLVVGGSMGGMQVLEWAALYPERVDAIAPIATSARHSAWCIGLSESQRFAIRNDPSWHGGHYGHGAGPRAGLGIARMIAIQSYRSWDSFEQRFSRSSREGADGEGDLFEVQSYLRYQAEKLVTRFDANTYIRLTEAMDGHDVGRGRGGTAEALTGIGAPALVVGIDSDALYPLQEQRAIADGLPDARFEVISAPHGHDGFLIETETLDLLLRRFREEIDALRAAPTGWSEVTQEAPEAVESAC